jgi:hypothetical protein
MGQEDSRHAALRIRRESAEVAQRRGRAMRYVPGWRQVDAMPATGRPGAPGLLARERQLDVCEIVDRWLGPDYRYYRVAGSDGDTILRHDHAGEWDLAAFRRGP